MIPSQDQLALPTAVLEREGPMRGRDVAGALAERVGVDRVERHRTVVVGEKKCVNALSFVLLRVRRSGRQLQTFAVAGILTL